MEVKFLELTLKNFKSHQDLTVNFGERTVITGDNAKGKSSIGEAITFLLYGTDLYGSKMDPTPVTYESDSTRVELLFEVDGKQTLLGREIAKGRNKYYINEVPSKATDFNLVVEQLFEKELFLSLFNPNYFFTLHWEKQREMILQYATPPSNKEVFKELSEPQAEKLAELVKKHSLEDLQKIHRENKNKKEKEHIAAQSKVKTLDEQLKGFVYIPPRSSLNSEKAQFAKQLEEIIKKIDEAGPTNKKINELQAKINDLLAERDYMKDEWILLKNEPIEDVCRTCKQPLQNEAVEAVIADKEKRISEFKAKFDEVVKHRKKLEEELQKLEYIDVSEQIKKSQELQDKLFEIEAELNKHDQLEKLEKDLEQAKKDEVETLKSLNESIFIIDAIKDFYAKEAELQAQKVQDLFETLSIKLFNEVKTTGELKPTFEIMMDGKEYKKLSLSESIRVGLEVRDVLSEQSNLIVPVFVDNAESITRFKQPIGQLIMAKVVDGKELTIEEGSA